MKTVAIIQARMGSTRLRGKMLMKLGDKPAIWWTTERVRMSELVDQVVVATSIAEDDDRLAQWCAANGVECFRGSGHDVLDRYRMCAVRYNAHIVVRVTGDCPLVDPALVDRVTSLCLEDDDVDYATNGEPLTYPEGMTVEALPNRVLEIAWREAKLEGHREHVTPYIRFHPERFRHATVRSAFDLCHIRLTLDYKEDLLALDQLVEVLKQKRAGLRFDLQDILNALEEHPEIDALLRIHTRDLWRQRTMAEEAMKDASSRGHGPG